MLTVVCSAPRPTFQSGGTSLHPAVLSRQGFVPQAYPQELRHRQLQVTGSQPNWHMQK